MLDRSRKQPYLGFLCLFSVRPTDWIIFSTSCLRLTPERPLKAANMLKCSCTVRSGKSCEPEQAARDYKLQLNIFYKGKKTILKQVNVNTSTGTSIGLTTSCCGHTPRFLRISTMSSAMLRPSTRAVPREGGISPVSMAIVVVLPAPLWPRSAVI